jgi:hypothetical protein
MFSRYFQGNRQNEQQKCVCELQDYYCQYQGKSWTTVPTPRPYSRNSTAVSNPAHFDFNDPSADIGAELYRNGHRLRCYCLVRPKDEKLHTTILMLALTVWKKEDGVHAFFWKFGHRQKKTPSIATKGRQQCITHRGMEYAAISAANAPQSAGPHGEPVRQLIFRFVTIRTITCSSQSFRRSESRTESALCTYMVTSYCC